MIIPKPVAQLPTGPAGDSQIQAASALGIRVKSQGKWGFAAAVFLMQGGSSEACVVPWVLGLRAYQHFLSN